MPTTPVAPAKVKRDLTRFILPACGLGVLVLATIIANPKLRPGLFSANGPEVTLHCKDGKMVDVYTPVYVNGRKVGEVTGTGHEEGEYPVRLTIRLNNEPLSALLCDEGAEWAIEGMEYNNPRDIIAAQRIVTGSVVVARPAKNATKPCHSFKVEKGPPLLTGTSFTVRFKNVHGMAKSTACLLNGSTVGRTVEMVTEPGGVKATIRLEDTPELAERVCRKSTRFYIMRARMVNLETRGEAAAFGAMIVIVPGNEKDPPCVEFESDGGEPPPQEVTWDSVRPTIYTDDARGLRSGAPVVDAGVEVGFVEHVGVQSVGRAEIGVALFTKDLASPYCQKTTRWYICDGRVTLGNLEISPENVKKGPYLMVVVDPTDTVKATGLTFNLEDPRESAPAILPRTGEKTLLAFSKRRIPRTMPFVFRDEPAGYIHDCKLQRDASGYLVELRVFPHVQPIVRTGSKLFIQERFSFKMVEWRKWFDIRGPQLNVGSNETLLNPAIEIVTPAADKAGGPVDWNPANPRPRLDIHAKPEAEWLNWGATVPTGDTGMKDPDLGGIQPVSLRLKWYYKKQPNPIKGGFNPLPGAHETKGVGLVLPNGIIGLQDLLEQKMGVPNDQIDEKYTEFEINGQPLSKWRQKPPLLVTGGSTRYMRLHFLPDKVVPLSLDRLGYAKEPGPLHIVLGPGNTRVIPVERLAVASEGGGRVWSITEDAAYDLGCHGAPVVSAEPGPSFGKIVGFVKVEDRGKKQRPKGEIHLLTTEAVAEIRARSE